MQKYLVAVVMLLASAFSAAAADVTGNWKGVLSPENRDPGPALVILKHVGDTVTGTAGPNEEERHEITNGKVAGDKVTFEVIQGEAIMKFVLTLAGDTLTGQVSREREGQQQTAKLDLKREN
jgi:hypothetical protein